MLDDLKQIINTSTNKPSTHILDMETDMDNLKSELNDMVARWGIDEMIYRLESWLLIAKHVRDNK